MAEWQKPGYFVAASLEYGTCAGKHLFSTEYCEGGRRQVFVEGFLRKDGGFPVSCFPPWQFCFVWCREVRNGILCSIFASVIFVQQSPLLSRAIKLLFDTAFDYVNGLFSKLKSFHLHYDLCLLKLDKTIDGRVSSTCLWLQKVDLISHAASLELHRVTDSC